MKLNHKNKFPEKCFSDFSYEWFATSFRSFLTTSSKSYYLLNLSCHNLLFKIANSFLPVSVLGYCFWFHNILFSTQCFFYPGYPMKNLPFFCGKIFFTGNFQLLKKQQHNYHPYVHHLDFMLLDILLYCKRFFAG